VPQIRTLDDIVHSKYCIYLLNRQVRQYRNHTGIRHVESKKCICFWKPIFARYFKVRSTSLYKPIKMIDKTTCSHDAVEEQSWLILDNGRRTLVNAMTFDELRNRQFTADLSSAESVWSTDQVDYKQTDCSLKYAGDHGHTHLPPSAVHWMLVICWLAPYFDACGLCSWHEWWRCYGTTAHQQKCWQNHSIHHSINAGRISDGSCPK